jgi:membrane protein YqaA with SNARE-associated domain
LWQGIKKAILPTILIVALLTFINYKYFNLNEVLKYFTNNFSDFLIFTVFFISESILGLLPPDIFIAWSKNSESPLFNLTILALLSYLGGIISYFLGVLIVAIPSVNKYLYGKMEKHVINMQKWGGFLIAVGALLPLPFAIACLAAGMIHYSRKYFFLFAALRFLRFVIYGFVIYNVLS